MADIEIGTAGKQTAQEFARQSAQDDDGQVSIGTMEQPAPVGPVANAENSVPTGGGNGGAIAEFMQNAGEAAGGAPVMSALANKFGLPVNEAPPEAPVLETAPALGAIADYMVEIGGTVKDNIAGGAYIAASTMLPVDRTLDLLSRSAESASEAGAQTMADRTLGGLADTLAGGKASVNTLLAGGNQEQANAAGEEAKNNVNLNLASAREEYKMASLAGDVAGSIMLGIGPSMAISSTMKAGSIVLPAMMSAFGEEVFYELNSDSSLRESVGAGLGAAALAGVGAAVFKGLGGAYRIVKGRGTNEIQREIGDQLYASMRASAAQNGQDLPLKQAIGIVDDMGADKIISDLYPNLTPRLQNLMTSPDPAIQRQGAALLSTRRAMEFDYRDAMLTAIRSPDVRTPTQFDSFINQSQKALRPKYDDLFNAMDNARYSEAVPTLRDSITRLVDDTTTTASDDLTRIMEIVQGPAGRENVTMREVNEIRKELGNEVYRRIRANASNANTTALPTRNLQAAQNYLNTLLRRNSTFATLQNTYGDLEAARNAYEFGQSIISKTGLDGADAEIFLQGNHSALSTQAFGEGGRFRMYSLAKSASDPASALRDGRLDDLAAVIGDDAVNVMRQRTTELVNMNRSEEAIAAGMENLSGVTKTRVGSDLAIDTRMALDSSGGMGAPFALRRLLQRATGQQMTPTASEVGRSNLAEGAAYLTRGGDSSALNAVQAGQEMSKAVPIAGGTGAGLMGGPTDTDPNAPPSVGSQILGKGADGGQWLLDLMRQRL